MTIMDPPEKPDEKDCCGSGCVPCIFDVYENELKRYNRNILSDNNRRATKKHNIISQMKYTCFVVKFIEKFYDFILFTFECIAHESDQQVLVYNSGQYFILKAPSKDSDSHFTRPYTPLNSTKCIRIQNKTAFEYNNETHFQIIVKLYDNGQMSSYLDNLNIGDQTMWRGPYGDYKYNSNYSKHILMIAQGTAIAPAYSIANEIINNEDDETRVMLMYCCRNIKSIVLRDVLYNLKSNWNFSYRLFLSQSNNDEIGSAECVIKYKEPITERKLTDGDIKCYLLDKSNVQALISGSDKFMIAYKEVLLDCGMDEKCIQLF